MILGQDALRWVTVQALKGRTWCGERVFDSPSQPADLKMQGDRASFIAVYTDDADVDVSETQGIAFGPSRCVLVIEVAATSEERIAQTTGDQDPTDDDVDTPPQPPADTVLAPTDEALEFIIGAISLQVKNALQATDNPWAELWRRLAPVRHGVQIRRGGPSSDTNPEAIRFASRVSRMEVTVIADPIAGAPLVNLWKDLFDEMERVEDLAPVAALLRPHFEASVLPDWRIAQKIMGVSTETIRSLGITAPIVQDEANAPPFRQAEMANGTDPDADRYLLVRAEGDEE